MPHRPPLFLWIVLALTISSVAVLAAGPSVRGDSLRRDSLDPYEFLNGAPPLPLNPERGNLRFDPGLWDPMVEGILRQTAIYIPDWRESFSLPPPPHNTSPRVQMELDEMSRLQAGRTPRHLEAIQQELNVDALLLERWFGETGKNKPLTQRLIFNAYHDAGPPIFYFKKQFARVRPSVLDPRIRPCIPVPGYAAYPSGHSTLTHTFAFVMQEILPDQAAFLQDEAFRIAWDREVAGLHYTSDTASGKELARQIVDLLLTKSAFQADLEKARAEWKKPSKSGGKT